MAKSWADMSKEERDATGKSKKEYNRSTGQSVIPKYAEKNAEPLPVGDSTTISGGSKSSSSSSKSNSSSSSTHTNSSGGEYTGPMTSAMQSRLDQKETEKEQEAARIEAKEKASSYLANHENAGKGGTRDAGFDAILKEGGLNNHQYQQMVNADKKTQYEANQKFRKESAEAYGQSRLDLQAEKAKHGPQNVYGRQSARDTHERSMSRGNPMVTGPQAAESANMSAANELAQNLYDTGYDYSHREMVRHRNGGAENKSMPGLYDEYGGYQNWYDNHSLFSGNFTGSKDLMDFNQVMETGQRQQDAMKNFQTSDEYMSKYGKYDWAQDYNEKYGRGAG